MRELDVLLERYLERRFSNASPEEQALFETFVDLPDDPLIEWLLKNISPPAQWQPLVKQILSIHF
jgi:succinate dehydrogenase flavin-adding protein (antitoxin of CptAB toxin-antitoxin module)